MCDWPCKSASGGALALVVGYGVAADIATFHLWSVHARSGVRFPVTALGNSAPNLFCDAMQGVWMAQPSVSTPRSAHIRPCSTPTPILHTLHRHAPHLILLTRLPQFTDHPLLVATRRVRARKASPLSTNPAPNRARLPYGSCPLSPPQPKGQRPHSLRRLDPLTRDGERRGDASYHNLHSSTPVDPLCPPPTLPLGLDESLKPIPASVFVSISAYAHIRKEQDEGWTLSLPSCIPPKVRLCSTLPQRTSGPHRCLHSTGARETGQAVHGLVSEGVPESRAQAAHKRTPA